MEMRDLLTRIQANAVQIQKDATDALGLLPPQVTAGPPLTYPNLKSDRVAYPVDKSVVVPNVLNSIMDPVFGTRIWRATDQTLYAGDSCGTLSGPNMCQISADDALFFAQNENGSDVAFFKFKPSAAVPIEFYKKGFFRTEPTFSRVRPGIMYAPYYAFQIAEYDIIQNTRTNLFDVQLDVGPLDENNGQYIGACYSSKSIPEYVICPSGGQQDTHPYATIINATDSNDRISIDVKQSRIKINGGAWKFITRFDGSLANLNYTIHSVSIDHSGEWARIDITGNVRHVFINIKKKQVYDWDDIYWKGHYAWGNGMLIRNICGPTDKGQFQWQLSEMIGAGLTAPASRGLITNTPTNNQAYDAHSNYNHARMDGRLNPILAGMQRGLNQTAAWKYLDEELACIATELNPPNEHYRICHHRSPYREFRDAPRAQMFNSGHAALFTSHWFASMGGRRDLFLVQF